MADAHPRVDAYPRVAETARRGVQKRHGDTVDETITTDVCVEISAGVGDTVIEERQQENIDFPDSDADGQSEDGAESELSADQADL